MKVVLIDNIKGIGQVGDVKNVSDGYARNFLLPRGLARIATQGIIKDVEALKSKKLAAIALVRQESEALAAKISGMKVTVVGKANEQGTLFAGIERQDIATALSKAAGIQIAADAVQLAEHLKIVGDHPVTIELADGVTAEIIVVVTAE